MYLSIFLSKLFSFHVEDSGRKMVELGWKSFADSLKNYWENFDGNLKSWLMIGRIIGMMEVA